MDNLTAKKLSPFMDLGKLAPNPTSQEAQGDLNKFYQTRSSPVAYWEEASQRYGIPELRTKVASSRQAIDDTNSMIRAVDPSVTGRTSNYNVTEAQRKALIAKEKTPLLGGLQAQSDIYGTAQKNYSDVLGEADTWRGEAYKTDENLLAALLQRLSYGLGEDEKAANARAAAAQQKAYEDMIYQQQLQQQQAQNKANFGLNVASWELPPNGLEVKPNYGFQAPNVNPQKGAWNPQQAMSTQKTGSVQFAANPQAWWNNPTINMSSPLKVVTKSPGKATVTPTKTGKITNVSTGGYGGNWKGNISVR